jgi:hypothetical protein
MKQIAPGWERTFSRRLPSQMASFAKNAGNLLRSFHKDVSTRAQRSGVGVTGIEMLQQQLGIYEAMFCNTADTVRDGMIKKQKDINRQFAPVITRSMEDGYDLCVAESGPGSFKRMKAHMENHVSTKKQSMFNDACDAVQIQLRNVLLEAGDEMAKAADEVLSAISRDYLTVLVEES